MLPSALAHVTEGEVALGTPYESFVGLPNVDSVARSSMARASVCQSRRTNANFSIIGADTIPRRSVEASKSARISDR